VRACQSIRSARSDEQITWAAVTRARLVQHSVGGDVNAQGGLAVARAPMASVHAQLSAALRCLHMACVTVRCRDENSSEGRVLAGGRLRTSRTRPNRKEESCLPTPESTNEQ
jgi:hypothetical protein